MKFKNIIKLMLIAAGIMIAYPSCKKQDFRNTEPNLITSTTVDFRTVLPASIAATATALEGRTDVLGNTNFKFLQNWMGYWARSGSFQDITAEESYALDNDFGLNIWNSLYANANNYNFIIKRANESGAGMYEAIARIMKAMDMQMLVDIFGNVPYSQAFLGTDNRTPAYDKGQAIYDSLFIELDKAIALLKDPVAINIDKNNGLYLNDLPHATTTAAAYDQPGAVTSWIKFANTLKLRMLIHASQAPGFDVAGKAAIIVAEGTGFIGAGESIHINPGYVATKPNPFYRAYVFTENGTTAPVGAYARANAYAVGPTSSGTVGYYDWNGDIRVDRFYTPPGSGTQRGIPYGEIAGTNDDNTGDKLSTVDGPGLLPNGPSSRAWIFTSVESLFLQSEAAQLGIITTGGSAEDILTSAVQESFVWLGLTAADADAYIALNAGFPDVDYNAPALPSPPGLPAGGIYTILSQKWFALNAIDPLEIWTDWRRTDIVYGIGSGFEAGPPLSVNPARPSGVGIPIRLFYPQNEYNYNANNVLAQGSIDVTQNATPATGRIFWDIN